MIKKSLMVALVGLLLAAGFATSAQAQIQVCSLVTHSPDSGLPGTVVTVSGSGALANSDVKVLWDGSPIDIIPADSSGNFSGTFTVPPDASVGDHTVTLQFDLPNEETVECQFTFTVIPPAVQETAYPVAGVSVLPSTGLMLLAPAAGLALGGLGVAILRRRRP